MKKRRVFLLAALLALVAVVIVAVWPDDSNEPRHNGKRLSEWIILYRNTDPGPEHDKAEAAISAIGTNAIPLLLHWVVEEPSPTRRKIRNSLPRWARDNQIVFSLLNARLSQAAQAAPQAFRALGTNAALAVPHLLSISETNNATAGAMAVIALAGMGDCGLPATLTIVTNGTARHRLFAMKWMAQNRSLYSDPAPLIPPLLSCLADNNWVVVANAAETLGTFKLRPDIVVPRLADALTNSRPAVRSAVIMALSDYGSNAVPALSSLSNCLADPLPGVTNAAIRAIERIQAQTSPGNAESKR